MAAITCRPQGASAQTSTQREYQVKAAFLFNFAQFVEWPSGAFTENTTPITIGVLGDDPFGPALEQVVQGEAIHGRPLLIQRAQRLEDLKPCHLLFISRSEKGRLPEILAQAKLAFTLTVSETDGFTRNGGVINFFLDEKKIRFEINPGAAQRKGLKISSQLLKLGKVVGPVRAREV